MGNSNNFFLFAQIEKIVEIVNKTCFKIFQTDLIIETFEIKSFLLSVIFFYN